eukprot:15446661-Alexandrium_andersonii.AAC.1
MGSSPGCCVRAVLFRHGTLGCSRTAGAGLVCSRITAGLYIAQQAERVYVLCPCFACQFASQ